jgi:hypothetical protein
LAATIVGWILVALVVYLAFGWLVSTLRFVLRILLVLVVVGALLALYLRLRGDD